MVVLSTILPAMLAGRTVDTMRPVSMLRIRFDPERLLRAGGPPPSSCLTIGWGERTQVMQDIFGERIISENVQRSGQSFWLAGLNAPSIVDAPKGYGRSWIGAMPNAHNGYYDTTLEMRYVGLVLLLVFIIATLHAIGRVADRSPVRAWPVLSLALYIIVYDY
jgi:hypothetical protein